MGQVYEDCTHNRFIFVTDWRVVSVTASTPPDFARRGYEVFWSGMEGHSQGKEYVTDMLSCDPGQLQEILRALAGMAHFHYYKKLA